MRKKFLRFPTTLEFITLNVPIHRRRIKVRTEFLCKQEPNFSEDHCT